jgi:PAS domain S-box-containing protein
MNTAAMDAHQISSNHLLAILDRTMKEGAFCMANGQFFFVNTALVSMFGYTSQAELLHKPASILFIDGTLLEKLIDKADDRPETIKCARKDKSIFWASFQIRIERMEDIDVYVGSLTDISGQLEQETQLRKKNDDLKKLNSQLDRFFYSTSHDIRQPLTSILGLVSLMRMEPSVVNTHIYLDKIEESVNGLDRFIRHIIDFSKNTHTRIRSELIDLNKLVSAAQAKLVQDQAFQEDINFSMTINGDYTFYSDADRIQTILEHVLTNAYQYREQKRSISYIKVLITLYAERAIFEIIDNGVGISKVHLDKVCDMFYRGHERSRGSGLGLYIVKETLLYLHGKIIIDSEINLGTMVQITIPNGNKGVLINRKKELALKN